MAPIFGLAQALELRFMAGKLKNCPICGKLYMDTGLHVCRDCYDKREKMESEIINFVRDNPNSTVPEIIEATGASEKLIKEMIRQGRFIQIGVKMSYPCKKCGAPIMTGEICKSCMAEMQKDLQAQAAKITAAKQAEKERRQRGMYSLHENRKK